MTFRGRGKTPGGFIQPLRPSKTRQTYRKRAENVVKFIAVFTLGGNHRLVWSLCQGLEVDNNVWRPCMSPQTSSRGSSNVQDSPDVPKTLKFVAKFALEPKKFCQIYVLGKQLAASISQLYQRLEVYHNIWRPCISPQTSSRGSSNASRRRVVPKTPSIHRKRSNNWVIPNTRTCIQHL